MTNPYVRLAELVSILRDAVLRKASQDEGGAEAHFSPPSLAKR
jgi:hypothetical protein